MMMHLKVRSYRTPSGNNINTTVFIGPLGQTLQNAGGVYLSEEAHKLFIEVISAGQQAIKDRLLVTIEPTRDD